MNRARRKEIVKIQKRLEILNEEVVAISSDIELLCEEEQEYFDNMPESIQDSIKGEWAEENINNLEETIETLSTIAEEIIDTTSNLEEAMEEKS